MLSDMQLVHGQNIMAYPKVTTVTPVKKDQKQKQDSSLPRILGVSLESEQCSFGTTFWENINGKRQTNLFLFHPIFIQRKTTTKFSIPLQGVNIQKQEEKGKDHEIVFIATLSG